jgi:hypothetical protein
MKAKNLLTGDPFSVDIVAVLNRSSPIVLQFPVTDELLNQSLIKERRIYFHKSRNN